MTPQARMTRHIGQTIVSFTFMLIVWQTLTTWSDKPKPHPLTFYGFEQVRPARPGDRLFIQFDFERSRRCPATAAWILAKRDNGEAVWQTVAQVGHTEPVARVKREYAPVTPLPKNIAPGDYVLVINRTDTCPHDDQQPDGAMVAPNAVYTYQTPPIEVVISP